MGAALIAALAGGLQAMSLATPWDGQPLWWLQLASLALLAGQLTTQVEVTRPGPGTTMPVCSARTAGWRGAGLGWVFATSWLLGTFWWLFISMHTYGGLPAVLAVLAVLALAGALALYYALVCAVFSMIFCGLPSAKWSFRALVFMALWTLAELARGRWLTGFPWGAGGYAHTDGPLAAYAPWLGVYGVGAVAAGLAVLMAVLLQGVARRAWGTALSVGAALVLGLAIPNFVHDPGATRSAGTQSVALLQGNIPQDEKFQPGRGVADALHWYGTALRHSQASLVVAPETAIPVLPQQLPEGYWAALQARFATGTQAALVGIPLGSYSEGYTNAVVGLRPGDAGHRGEVYRYDKHHLVPFGEFIPPLFRWFVAMMQIPLGDFDRGPLRAPSFEWLGQRLAPNICYEDLFGEELGARFVEAADAPTALVNASNIGWFGDTVAIDQHLQISRMRALEFARPMLRATNTGATVIIDHRGVVTRALERHTRGVLTGTFEGRTGLTPYARWVSRGGLWPLWGLALGIVVLAVWRARGAARRGVA